MEQMVVGGVRLRDELGLVMLAKPSLGHPAPKTYSVDVPGGSGMLDLTEAVSGEVAYSNRQQVFEFDVFGDFEAAKTRVANLLHGKRFEYSIPQDPGYRYYGRFAVKESTEARRGKGRIRIAVDADPYKLKETCTYRVNAAGGIAVTLESGRMPVCPTFEFASETIVACGDVFAQMQPGSYKVNDLWLHEGINEIYINSYLGDGNVTAERYANDTIGMHADRRISDLIWEGIRGAAVAIEDWAQDTIGMHAGERIIDAEFAVASDTEEYAVYIQYPWKDL